MVSHKRKEKKQKKFKQKYLTRNQAIKRLQVDLADFRKICILKGIHPRQPPHMGKSRKIYYFTKDISFLQHDKILAAIKDKLALKKKIPGMKLKKTKREVAKKLKAKKGLPLNHLVRERYPTFQDALSDLDDPLTLVSMFAAISPEYFQVKAKRILSCIQLMREWKYYVAQTHSLRKAFVSIKGIYYQAIVNGVTITWITPHHSDVPFRDQHKDTKVMSIFLKFYVVLLGFVNFKLYSSIGLSYPTFYNSNYESAGLTNSLAGVIAKPISQNKVKQDYTAYKNKRNANGKSAEQQEQDKRIKSLNNIYKNVKVEPVDEELTIALRGEEDAKIDEFIDLSEPAKEEDKKNEPTIDLLAGPPQERLFKGLYFFLGDATPVDSLEFIIRSMGGECSYADGPYPESSDFITHQVVDRKVTHHYLSREYIQPQWVYDCLNVGVLLPIHEYAPGVTLPPHLSPFVQIDPEGGYVPKRHFELQELVEENQENEEGEEEEEEIEEYESEEEDPDILEQQYQKEIRAEAKGTAYSDQLKKDEKNRLKQEKEDEERQRKEEFGSEDEEDGEEDAESAQEDSEEFESETDEPKKKRPKVTLLFLSFLSQKLTTQKQPQILFALFEVFHSFNIFSFLSFLGRGRERFEIHDAF
eukprot:TRINITY_DN5026_c0_g1_i1.p1 TRINITY_DN5026_c0_g1~~TRINITY_DN5026_c0_g1_i1.p1  ORF type:complete len:641 (+),score=187.31 TRINITY_DN5026_c0_g1_i1:158-2080(+)